MKSQKMSGAQKSNLGNLGPEDISSHKFRTLAPIFTKKNSFSSQESWDKTNKINLKKFFDLGAWGLEDIFGSLEPTEDISNNRSRMLASVFTSRTSLSQELWDQSNKIIKYQKISWPWGLGSRNYIWVWLPNCIWRLLANELLLSHRTLYQYKN